MKIRIIATALAVAVVGIAAFLGLFVADNAIGALIALIITAIVAIALIASVKSAQQGTQKTEWKEILTGFASLAIVITILTIAWNFVSQQRPFQESGFTIPLVGWRVGGECNPEQKDEGNGKYFVRLTPCHTFIHVDSFPAGTVLLLKASGQVRGTDQMALTIVTGGGRNSCRLAQGEGEYRANGPFSPSGSMFTAVETQVCLGEPRLFPVPQAPYMGIVYRDGATRQWQYPAWTKVLPDEFATYIRLDGGTFSLALNMGFYEKAGSWLCSVAVAMNTPFRPNERGCFRERFLREYTGGFDVKISRGG